VTQRITDPATHQEFERALVSIFPNRRSVRLDAQEISRAWALAQRTGNRWAVWDGDTKMLLFFLVARTEQQPLTVFALELFQEPDQNDLKFARCYARVFNEDLRTASELRIQAELWASLQQTRFARAVGRFSPFTTENFMRWIRTVENASNLRYEGQPFSASILMTKQIEWATGLSAARFIRFSQPLRFERALLEENWIRALITGSELILVGLSVAGRIVGVLTFTGAAGDAKIVPPHSKLGTAAAAVIPGTMLFIAAKTGDVYVLLPQGATFLKQQGRWRYLNHKWLRNILITVADERTVAAITRIILDLSFDRTGGLIAILEDQREIKQAVRDHRSPKRPNYELRDSLSGLLVNDPSHLQVIRAAAAIDGATVLSRSGEVLDVACMVGDPDAKALERVGKTGLRRFPGARSTAAWNISIFGLSIKVSEDGPITIFQRGNVLLEIG
jgi:hypothetical protein